MKKKCITLKRAGTIICSVLLSLSLIKCKKDGPNASVIDRSLSVSQMDSTVFSPFYDTTILNVAITKSKNDIIVRQGVKTIISSNCGKCHSGNVKPNLNTYNDIAALVVPGNPEASKLWQLITTNDLNKAMPPVNNGAALSTQQKGIIYNWIKNGAKETPTLADYRPAAIRIITGGCTAQCHNENLVVGTWSRTFNLGRSLTSNDTVLAVYNKIMSINDTLSARVWGGYTDSVKKYYTDTINNLAYKPRKSNPGNSALPLENYQNILFEIMNPNRGRSNSNPMNIMTTSYNLLTKVDSTLGIVNLQNIPSNPSGNMAYSDGHLTSSEIAIIKGWYFLDPNITDRWKYGPSNQGIFKDKGGNMIIKR